MMIILAATNIYKLPVIRQLLNMLIKRTNFTYSVTLFLLVFCLVYIHAEAPVGQKACVDWSLVFEPNLVLVQSGSDAIQFEGQLMDGFDDNNPQNYNIRLLDQNNNEIARYHFDQIGIGIDPPNTAPFKVTLGGNLDDDFKIGNFFGVYHQDYILDYSSIDVFGTCT